MHLVGEPIFKPYQRERFDVPAGQAEIVLSVLKEVQDVARIKTKLQEEYLSIILALKTMDVDFRIVCAHQDEIDTAAMLACVGTLGCRLVGFPRDYFPPSVAYPRDFSTVLPGLVLINQGVQVLTEKKDGWVMVSSPFGEGGTIHAGNGVAIVCERVCRAWGQDGFRHLEPEDLIPLECAGVTVVRFPAFASLAIVNLEISNSCFSNNHIDRVSAWLRGRDGKNHLLVDGNIVGTDWSAPSAQRPWRPMPPQQVFDELSRRCEPHQIAVHAAPPYTTPYALNLIQFPDSKVLMTGGEPALEALVESIVGKGNVFTTKISIRFFPVWLYAGIRCLIGDYPEPLFKKLRPA